MASQVKKKNHHATDSTILRAGRHPGIGEFRSGPYEKIIIYDQCDFAADLYPLVFRITFTTFFVDAKCP